MREGPIPAVRPVGEAFILDATEQATIDAAVTQMNTYIQAKATEIKFAYFDPNPVLTAQKAPGGCVNAIPNLAAAATVSPFGTCISFDGMHPSEADSASSWPESFRSSTRSTAATSYRLRDRGCGPRRWTATE